MTMKKCANSRSYDKDDGSASKVNSKQIRQGASTQAFKGVKVGHSSNNNTGKGKSK